MGAGNPPTIFWTWGGGPLQQFIKAGRRGLARQPELGVGLPALLAGRGDLRRAALRRPDQGTQPVYFFYNKPIFASSA